MRKNSMCVAETIVQLISMVVLYPILIALAIKAKMSRAGFTSVSKVRRLWIFPAFGKWYLPMIWMDWHY